MDPFFVYCKPYISPEQHGFMLNAPTPPISPSPRACQTAFKQRLFTLTRQQVLTNCTIATNNVRTFSLSSISFFSVSAWLGRFVNAVNVSSATQRFCRNSRKSVYPCLTVGGWATEPSVRTRFRDPWADGWQRPMWPPPSSARIRLE